jgi:hypothetical protein
VWQPSSNRLSNGVPIYVDEDPPVIFTVVPGTGPVRGGTVITISGDHFFPNARVEVGGLTATPLQRTETEITAVVPPGSAVGQSVSVRVTQGTGDHEVPAAWLYGENPIDFTWNGTPNPGANITITVYGPSHRDVAVAAGTPGETQALGMIFCAESPFPFVRKLNANLNTGPTGRVDVVWAGLPGEVFDQWNLIGVIKVGPGTFQNLGCVPLTVLP